ncbi:hypothetical protein CF54_00115 [Streptomyces sp. Tu 6176]|uniref:DUF4232 domain-containing protein n=1 Tax=Streptomyces sp. Tu 6176 TaxID=1470557 RepID=UPI000452BE61|nr:DUF4232 domain-containing protein [Streptomyces sp. Tu 6176]EYT84695.1 hypothetical protein CF54_00115 [Streptomyces sp. Tu 6176]
MSARTRRTRRTRLFTAAAIAAAALSLTACQSGGDDNGAGAASSTAPAGSVQNEQPSGAASAGTKAPDGTGTGTGAGSGTGTGSGSGSGSGSAAGKGSSASGGTSKSGGSGSGAGSPDTGDSDASSGKLAKCGAKTLRFKAATVSRPLNHLLITATNTGSRTCMLPMYPAARFGEAQSVPPVAEETKPQAVTTLEPGQSGYAGVLLSGDGDHGHTVTTLTIPFDDGSIGTVALPGRSVYVDDKLTVTYWESTMEPAVDF